MSLSQAQRTKSGFQNLMELEGDIEFKVWWRGTNPVIFVKKILKIFLQKRKTIFKGQRFKKERKICKEPMCEYIYDH